MKITNKTKTLIKDIELQIDYLIGYQPTGGHWKSEYHLRENMIDEFQLSEFTPEEARFKLNTMLDSLHRLREEIRHDQDYITYSELEFDQMKMHPIKVHDWKEGEYIL